MENTSPSVDSGAQIRDGVKSVANLGVCKETTWPYDDQNKNPAPCTACPYAKKPSAAAYKEALKYKIKVYQTQFSTAEYVKRLSGEWVSIRLWLHCL